MQYLVFDDMTQCTDEAVQRLLPRVPDFRREQAMKYHHTFGQFCCLKSWFLLQSLFLNPQSSNSSLISNTYNLIPTFNEYGKPYFADGPEFSISHCKHAIAVAINDTPIGIDVESIRRVEQSLIERTMNDEEQTIIRAADDPARAFTRLWTMKEAYLKYLGIGIIDDLHHALDTAIPARFTIKEQGSYVFSIYR